MKKYCMIGLDGVPFELIESYANSGNLDNIKKIIKSGRFCKINSTLPEISSVAWSSIITGKNPGEHSNFGFTDIYDKSYRIYYPNFSNLKALPFWLKNNNKKHLIINVPNTYPVRELNGIHISGFVSPELENSIYPKELVGVLKEIDYRIDVDVQAAKISPELFFKELNFVLNKREELIFKLIRQEEMDYIFLVFTGTDRLMHFYWDGCIDEKHHCHEKIKEYFIRIDKIIGDIYNLLSREFRFIIFSDHGFEKNIFEISLNRFLYENGFLKFRDEKKKHLRYIDKSSTAFALDPGRIYIHSENRFPSGKVSYSEKDKLVELIIEKISRLEYHGRKVLKQAYRGKDVYSGQYSDQAPDIVLIANENFMFKAGWNDMEIVNKSSFAGKHSFDNAFVIYDNIDDDNLILENVQDIYKLFINEEDN